MKRNKIFILLITYCFLCAGVLLDGVDDYLVVTATGVSDFEPIKKLSVAMWVKRTGACEDDADLFHKSINNGTATPYNSWVLQCNGASDIDYIVYITCAGTRRHTATVTLLPIADVWVHLVVTFDRDGGDQPIITIYKDGVSVLNETLVVTGNITYETDAGEGHLYFGAEGTEGTHSGAFHYAEIAYWKDIVLTAPEVEILAKSKIKYMPLQIQKANLKLYLPLHDLKDGISANAGTFSDMSGNGHNATGDDGAKNTGCTAKGEEILTYPR